MKQKAREQIPRLFAFCWRTTVPSVLALFGLLPERFLLVER